MFTKSFAAVVLLAVFSALLISVTYGQSPNCLGCLCEASSGCNKTIGCSSHAGYHCGPFLLSYSFWADAGQPVPQGLDPQRKGSFEACANDIFCAADTVALYIKKFEQDCNGDGQVTCKDYALIHKLGGYGCRGPVPQNNPFFQTFYECISTVGEQ
ncbi:Invertebrate-type lysozyme [Trinorchestia longiramus]|nr:Invertebrate-type lysozyme [Trinorchestia longiramus]